MHITTMHTLTFTIKSESPVIHQTALSMVSAGAMNMGLVYVTNPAPLKDGAKVESRGSSIQVMSDDLEKCEHFWGEIIRALALIGVEITSP